MMTITELRQNIWQRLENMEAEKLTAVVNFLDSLDISSPSQYHEQEMGKSDNETRKELIKSLRGMATHSSFSSDEFARQKQKEIDWEERNL
jgi:hypothetical protein